MRRLFEIDLKDYNESDTVFRRPSARAIIQKGDKLALVYSKKEKHFKFPGGGIHDDEDKKEALIREVREEVGLVVIPESIREYGSVLRRQKSTVKDGEIFEQENYYYFCDVQERPVSQELDDYEDEAGFVLKIVDIDEAIETNAAYASDDFFNEVMIKREERVLEMLKQEREMNDEESPWMEADGRIKESLEKQARCEITEEHELFEVKDKLVAVAKCEANDDALFFCDDKYYLIHLTWGKGSSKYPQYTIIEKDKIDDYLRDYEW